MPAGKLSQTELVGSLYSEHHGWLISWLRRKLGCPHSAADLAQDAFMRVMACGDVPALREPRAFLVTTARRLIIDQARRQRLERAYLAELELLAPQMEGFPAPEQILAAVETLARIGAALEGLAEKPRLAFLFHYLDDEPQAAIAARLGVSTRMVQKYLVQALVHCHAALEA